VHLEDAHLILKALQSVIECATLVCELGGETVDGLCACFFNGRDAKANSIYSARSLSLQGCAF
jgi:hypothetical protein